MQRERGPSASRYLIQLIVLASALLISPHLALATDEDERAWEMVSKKIHDFLTGRDPNFDNQYLIKQPAVPLYADWSATNKRGLYTLYSVTDSAPVWNPVWVPTDATFSDAYESFVRSIQLPQPTPVQIKLQQTYTKAQNHYGEVIEEKKQNWLKYDANQRKNPPPTWTTREKWYEIHAAADIMAANDAMLESYTNYFNSLDATAQIHARAVHKIDVAQRIDIVMPDSAQNFNASDDDPTSWTTEQKWPVKFDSSALTKLISDGEAQVKAGALADTWIFDSTQLSRDEERKSWGGSASYGPFFHASVSHNETSINFKSSGTYIKFGYYAITQVPISPVSSWYDANLVRDFACGPFKPSANTKPTDWWGEHGKLNAIPISVVLAYRPEIEAMLTAEQFNFFESSTSGHGGLSIGPFGIGGGGSSFKQHIDKDKKTGHIKITTESSTPMVVAVIYQKLGKACN